MRRARERDWYVPDPDRPEPAPAADGTYFGAYGITNPWVAWLIRRAPNLVARTPDRMLVAAPIVPSCPDQDCSKPMVSRPGAWCCYRHDETIRVLIEDKFERAPDVDVLSRVQQPLDAVLVNGKWKVRRFTGFPNKRHTQGGAR